MSVIVTLWIQGDPKKLEDYAASNTDAMQEILDFAKERGVIAHRFYGSDDNQIMVVDEWPDEQSFQSFFEESTDRIGPLMEAAGATSQPQIKCWHKLDTHDEHGWNA